MPVGRLLRNIGLRSWHLEAASLGSIALCIALWSRAASVDQDDRGNAERRALFVANWAPMLWLISQSVREFE